MSYTYAIGDVHGMYDLLKEALNYAINDTEGPKTIVMLGDYVDRGPKSAQCLEELINFDQPDVKLICLKGNHEDMMVMSSDNKSNYGLWLINGGNDTLQSYDPEDDSLLNKHREWIKNLPTMYEDEHRYYVHAAMFKKEDVEIWQEDLDHMRMWYRYTRNEKTNADKYVVHGHTPQKEEVFVGEDRCNLDVGSCFYGRLAVGKFNDEVPGRPESLYIVH